jgi:amidase
VTDPISAADVERLAAQLDIALAPGESEALAPFVAGMLSPVATLDELERSVTPPVPEGDRRWWTPMAEENPLGAWYVRSAIRARDDGPLAGMRVAVKDNVAVAGLPMSNGSVLLDGFVPSDDATVVSRVLAAGGEIAGKAMCEDLCLSAGSNTSFTGPVRNPWDPAHTSGGSSSGCGALLGSGQVELAIGGDQGGSIRVPAAYCGVVGLKPTWGLVPYTGACSIDPSLDHLGPMGPDVAAVALLLEVLAGAPLAAPSASGPIRVGALTEGFGVEGADERVDTRVREALGAFAAAGASCSEVSVPWHRRAGAIGMTLLTQGVLATLRGEGWFPAGRGRAPVEVADAWASSRAEHAGGGLPPTAKVMALAAAVRHGASGRRDYGRAQNLVPALTAAYDRALADVDVLAMPTAPNVAPRLPEHDDTVSSLLASFSGAVNTAQFDVTGHPAISVPCGNVAGLPVGIMLVGRRGDDAGVLRVAAALEQAVR